MGEHRVGFCSFYFDLLPLCSKHGPNRGVPLLLRDRLLPCAKKSRCFNRAISPSLLTSRFRIITLTLYTATGEYRPQGYRKKMATRTGAIAGHETRPYIRTSAPGGSEQNVSVRNTVVPLRARSRLSRKYRTAVEMLRT